MSYPERIRKQIESQKQLLESLFVGHDLEQLGQRPSPKRWNALECVRHINISLKYYNRQIDKSIAKAKAKGQSPNEEYRPGLIGERFARWLAPRDGVVRRKVPTLSSYNPIGSAEARDLQVVANFNSHMDRLADLAQASSAIDLDKTRVRSPFGNIFRFKLGDAFHIILAHNERHLLQARMAIEATKGPVSI